MRPIFEGVPGRPLLQICQFGHTHLCCQNVASTRFCRQIVSNNWWTFTQKVIIHSQKWSFTHFLRQNVASRIYALLSSNPPECQDWGKGGGVKPILAMPGFSLLLLQQPLPNHLRWNIYAIFELSNLPLLTCCPRITDIMMSIKDLSDGKKGGWGHCGQRGEAGGHHHLQWQGLWSSADDRRPTQGQGGRDRK